MIMATMKRRVDRLLSSQTAVGGRRPVAAGDRYISLAGRWRSSMLKPWHDVGLVPVNSSSENLAQQGDILHLYALRSVSLIIAGFAVLLVGANETPNSDIWPVCSGRL